MPAVLGAHKLDVRVAADGGEGEGLVAHHGVIPRCQDQCPHLQIPDVFIFDLEMGEHFVGAAEPHYLDGDALVEIPHALGLLQVLQVHYARLPPEFHLLVLQDGVLQVGPDEETLVVLVHALGDVLNIEGGRDQHQAIDIAVGMCQHVAQAVVAAQRGADHVDGVLRVVHPDAGQRRVDLVELDPREGDGAGHLRVDAPTVDAHAAVGAVPGRLHQHLDVLGLATPGHPVHDHHDRPALFGLVPVRPVQRHVTPVVEMDVLPVEVDGDLRRGQLIQGLQEVVAQVEGGSVDVGIGGRRQPRAHPLQQSPMHLGAEY